MLVLVQRPKNKSIPDPAAAPKNIPFGTIFIEFGDTKKCCTLSGLEITPCARLRKAAHWPNNNANPSGLSEKKAYCVEKRNMCDP